MILYIIRHGEPNYAIDHLTETGWLQAEAVGERMAKIGLDRIFTSPMGRARDTSAPTCRLLNMEAQIEDWSHEIGIEIKTPYPDGEPKSISLLQNTIFRQDGRIDLGREGAFDCPGIRESGMKQHLAFLKAHGDDFLERLGYRAENDVYRILRPSEERVALFCHAAMGRAWISQLLGIPLNVMWASFSYEFTGVTKLEFKNNPDGFTAPTCHYFSDISHLYAKGLAL